MSTHRRQGSRLLVVLTMFAVVSVSGCGQTQPVSVPGGAYHAEFEQAKSGNNSPYVAEMLADDQITDAEFTEAQAKVVTCLKELGWDASWAPNDVGLLDQLSIATSADVSTTLPDVLSCKAQWLGVAESLYWSVKNNPNNDDFNGLVAACLVRVGFAPRGFTGKDLEQLIAQSSAAHVIGSEREPEVVVDTSDESAGGGPLLPDGTQLYRPETAPCRITPLAVK